MTRRRLALRRETLTALTEDGLASVQGGTVARFERPTVDCKSTLPWECGVSIPMPVWTQQLCA